MSTGLKRKVKNKVNTSDKTKKLTQVKIPLDEKIEIFEKFLNTGNTIKGNTVFEGYPIGQWAIQIRSAIKKQSKNERTNRTSYIKITEEQLNKLNTLGILDRQIEATLDEKIDMLIQWMAQYPKANMRTYIPKDILKEYASTEEEYLSLTTQYQNMQRYYNYIVYIKCNGKLSKKQFSKCKKGNVRGVFGYPTSIEELAKETGQPEKYIDYIVNYLGTLENFINLYRANKLDEKDLELARSMIRNVIDIDLNPNSTNYDNLYNDILGSQQDNSLKLYSSKKLQAQIEHLKEREKLIIEKVFGLPPYNSSQTFESIGNEMGVSGSRIGQIKEKAIRKLRNINSNKEKTFSYNFNQSDNLTDDERIMFNNIEKMLHSSRLIFKNNPYMSTDEDVLKAFELIKKMDEKRKEQMKEMKKERKSIILATHIDDLEFSRRTYNALKRTGICTLGDISNLTAQKLSKIRNLGEKSCKEVIEKLKEYGLSLKEKEDENDVFIDEVLNQATVRINIRKQDEQAKELAKDYEKIDKNGRLK